MAKAKVSQSKNLSNFNKWPKVIYKAYAARSNITGKYYVGITSREVFEREKQHKTLGNGSQLDKPFFAQIIEKHGSENFKFEWVASSWCKEGIAEIEKLLIIQYDSFRNGYNSNRGGARAQGMSLRVKKKIAKWHKGRKKDPIAVAKSVASRKGKKINISAKGKASQIRALTGRKLSKTAKARISTAKKEWWARKTLGERTAFIKAGWIIRYENTNQEVAVQKTKKTLNLSSETRSKLSLCNKGKKKKPITIQRMRKPKSDSHRKKLSEAAMRRESRKRDALGTKEPTTPRRSYKSKARRLVRERQKRLDR